MSNFLTRDNLLLSEPVVPIVNRLRAVNCTQIVSWLDPIVATCIDPSVRALILAATSANTRRAYRSDLKHFLSWGGEVPASPMLIAQYLARYAAELSVATLRRRIVAIGRAHAAQNILNPCETEVVRLAFQGIRRTYGRPQRRVKALTKEHLVKITALLGDSVRDIRDLALLLIGFGGAFRRSELSAVDCTAVSSSPEGIVVTLRKSKTDQEGEGRSILISYDHGLLCPVRALQRWKAISEISAGPIFRPIDRFGHIGCARLSSEAIALIVKKRVAAAGFDASHFSGHSLRAGYVTSAVQSGVPTYRICRQTGHASDQMLSRYIRDDEMPHLAAGSRRIVP